MSCSFVVCFGSGRVVSAVGSAQLSETPRCSLLYEWPTPSSFLVAKELSHTINLHPSFFGPRTEGYLHDKLNKDVEGTCTGRFGYIIAVLRILNVSAGTIQPGTGMAEFVIKYSVGA
ncbi:DNA-directed RNA polymerase II subunit rpb7 [Puccinia sorghi]|uniref:DNA-directed RNA polymerase II subunit rpb7 n=1 Tax=Puccinia sorghi TaxID=27349 RepID=A0A0L6VST1_9BASI|nr:DNA-directed RNA polymerase II subunit rpb7 [Puccinia sorghi]